MGRIDEVIDRAVDERGAALMGILNVTPDSFFDGGRFFGEEAAVSRVEQLLADGADIIDLGAESSRPRATPVPPSTQIERLGPALERAAARGALVSVDTTSPEVARWALGRGAAAVNDVSCLADPELARVVADHRAHLVLMHMRGALGSMRGFSDYPDDGYHDLVEDVLAEWAEARDRALAAGVERSHILFDPGLGFAKNSRQSLELLRRLGEFSRAGVRVVVGPSRKSFVAALDPVPPEDRLGGTITACLVAVTHGATVLRVHDVQAVRQALMVLRATLDPGEPLYA